MVFEGTVHRETWQRLPEGEGTSVGVRHFVEQEIHTG